MRLRTFLSLYYCGARSLSRMQDLCLGISAALLVISVLVAFTDKAWAPFKELLRDGRQSCGFSRDILHCSRSQATSDAWFGDHGARWLHWQSSRCDSTDNGSHSSPQIATLRNMQALPRNLATRPISRRSRGTRFRWPLDGQKSSSGRHYFQLEVTVFQVHLLILFFIRALLISDNTLNSISKLGLDYCGYCMVQ